MESNSVNSSDKAKSRENILAERQAKKLAKQNVKKKDKSENNTSSKINASGDGSVKAELNYKNETMQKQDKVSNEPKGKTVKGSNLPVKTEVPTKERSKTSNEKSKVQTVVDNISINDVKTSVESTDVVDGDISVRTKLESIISKNDVKTCVESTDAVDREISVRIKLPVLTDQNENKKEKSREEIMVEREAKKLVKLAKKQKGKEAEQPASTKENVPVSSVKPDPSAVDKKPETGAEKSKAELRAERRAKQEAQRAAKDVQKKTVVPSQPTETKVSPKKPPDAKKEVVKAEEKVSEFKGHQHKLFSHLYVEPQSLVLETSVHPAIVELGKKYAARVVNGSNARCVSLLYTLKQVISDYRVTATSDLNRGLEAELAAAGSYLSRSRPLSVSMTNSLRYLRSHLTQTSQLPEQEAKRRLLEAIDLFIREQVEVAAQAISNTVKEKISNGDVILTYGCSSLVLKCLTDSFKAGKEFSVVVVDGGPWYEGRELLRRLADLSIPCTYLLISAVGFAITKISKVLLGAHALLANGYVMSRTGSAMVALTASAHSVPVLVCCETYKFCERVQADAFVYNELGGCDEVAAKGVKCLSPVYDITPPNLVTAVVTELAILPCTSVPVVLRVKPSDIHQAT